MTHSWPKKKSSVIQNKYIYNIFFICHIEPLLLCLHLLIIQIDFWESSWHSWDPPRSMCEETSSVQLQLERIHVDRVLSPCFWTWRRRTCRRTRAAQAWRWWWWTGRGPPAPRSCLKWDTTQFSNKLQQYMSNQTQQNWIKMNNATILVAIQGNKFTCENHLTLSMRCIFVYTSTLPETAFLCWASRAWSISSNR